MAKTVGFIVYVSARSTVQVQRTVDRVETYLFHGSDLRRVLPERMCSIRTREAINCRAWVQWDYGRTLTTLL